LYKPPVWYLHSWSADFADVCQELSYFFFQVFL
jgi:hypothetical protein